jgi:uncharacterized membrane protein
MRTSRVILMLLTLLLLVVSIYETWITGKLYGLISVIAFAMLLPYEFSKAFPPPSSQPKPGKH